MKKNYSVSKVDSFYHDCRLVAVTVERAAVWFGVSTRRIRQMLIDGKLKGTKHGKVWYIDHPYQITIGRRGLLAGKYQSADITFKNRRNTFPFQNAKIKQGDGKSFIG